MAICVLAGTPASAQMAPIGDDDDSHLGDFIVDKRVISRRGIDSGLPVTLADLPPHVAQAVLASEDRRFYSHFGLDFWGWRRGRNRP